MLSKQYRLKLLMYSTKNVTCGIMHISIYYFTHLGLFALQISSYCVQNTLFVDKQQQNGDSSASSYDQKLKMSKVSLTTLQAVNCDTDMTNQLLKEYELMINPYKYI